MLVSDPPGLSLTTSRDMMLRAVLESIAFSLKQLVEAFLSETNYKEKCLFLVAQQLYRPTRLFLSFFLFFFYVLSTYKLTN